MSYNTYSETGEAIKAKAKVEYIQVRSFKERERRTICCSMQRGRTTRRGGGEKEIPLCQFITLNTYTKHSHVKIGIHNAKENTNATKTKTNAQLEKNAKKEE